MADWNGKYFRVTYFQHRGFMWLRREPVGSMILCANTLREAEKKALEFRRGFDADSVSITEIAP